jgi:glycosyltransferase involved in cell wall biosynthesis
MARMQQTNHWRDSDQHSPVFVLLSFEGPDPYARAGGLGARVSGLACALAEEGYETHLFFIGSPQLAGHELVLGGKLHLHRWCQWISRYHPHGVYDGEEGKLSDWSGSLPPWLEQNLFPALLAASRPVIVIGEEWQTTWSLVEVARRAAARGWSDSVRCFWNANNTFGFERIPWKALQAEVTITSVSRFMKHEMWRFGVDPLVIPNGIAREWFEPCERGALHTLKAFTDRRLLLSKVARWDPAKRWIMALDAIAELKGRGERPLLVARGGSEAHGQEVIARAQALGLASSSITCSDGRQRTLCESIAAACVADIVLVQSPLSRAQLQLLYRASDGVLANSGFEPFGLVGLEAMACGGLSYLGATGEDYATPGFDAISVQTNSPTELVRQLMHLKARPQLATRMRRQARRTAERFTWSEVIRTHMAPLLSGSA